MNGRPPTPENVAGIATKTASTPAARDTAAGTALAVFMGAL